MKNEIIKIKENIVHFIVKSKHGIFTGLIDYEDLHKVENHTWTIVYNSRSKKVTALEATINSKSKKLHRLVLNINNPTIFIDHVNGNPLDNRKSNIRIATGSQNGINRGLPKNNTSGHKGVNWRNMDKKWQARLSVNGKRISLGMFKTKEEAALAYNEAAIKYFGEFAKLNEV